MCVMVKADRLSVYCVQGKIRVLLLENELREIILKYLSTGHNWESQLAECKPARPKQFFLKWANTWMRSWVIRWSDHILEWLGEVSTYLNEIMND